MEASNYFIPPTASASSGSTHRSARAAQVPLVQFQAVGKRYGQLGAVDALTLDIYQGEFFALLGPSGCGKTTLLRLLAGFERPTAGRILLDRQDLGDTPPHRRPVNMMFQSYALFPHLTVERNVAFGLKQEGMPKNDIARRVAELLALVRLERYAGRKPDQLSGGERQRVALARSLAKRPRVLLLDEPMAALDKKLRQDTQFELMELQAKLGTTFLIVTHDQDEAMALASRIAVMDRGHVVQVGTPAEIYEFPRSRFVADFVGTTNLFEGTVSACDGGLISVCCSETGGELLVDDAGSFAVGQRVWISLRPEKVRLAKQPANGARVNQLRGTVWELGYLGNRSTYQIKTTSGKLVTVFAQNERRTSEALIDWNDEVFVSWSADAAVLLQT